MGWKRHSGHLSPRAIFGVSFLMGGSTAAAGGQFLSFGMPITTFPIDQLHRDKAT
jgi:hypothetical protein